MYRNKFISLLLIFALSMPFLTLPVEPAGASDYLEEIWGSAYKFEGDEIPIADLSDLADIDFNQIKMNHLGELVVPYADKIGQQNVATSVYYKDGAEVSKAVYGEIGIKLPRIISGEGGFIIIKRNGNLIESPAVETLWLPLIGDTTKPHHHKDNPLQKVSVAWKTEYDWVKLDIVPRSSADMDLSNSSTMNNLRLNPRMYNPTTKVLYSDIGKSEGQLRMADGAPLKIDSTKFIVPSNNLLTINYADSLATVQDTCYAEYGIIILSPEGAGEIKNVIIKAEEKEAYYTTSRYGGIPVPLLSDRTIPYNAATNPIYKEIEIAWQFAGEDTWESALIKFVSKTDDFFKGAKTYTASLKLHPSLYDPDSKIIYSDASQESGELKAQDGTSITRDNLISQSGGIITVNYADTFVTVTQEVYGQDTSGHLLLQLPENIADTDPRFIMQVGDLEPELITIAGDFLAVPLLDKARNLQDAVIAWRSKTEGWFKVTIKPQKEYKKPQVISVHPTGEIVDESAFSPETINGKRAYFLKVVFADADTEKLIYDDMLISKIHGVDVFAVGGSRQSMLDYDLLEYASKLTGDERGQFIEKYLFRKEEGRATLYIPVRKLLAQADYKVEIPSGLVGYRTGVGNDLITWNFGTIGSPQVTDISLGSIGEDYDVREPIHIYGNYFTGDNIKVKFNDIEAYRLNVREEEGKSYLEVYLPRGRDRLKPGLYNILVIKNNNEIYSQTLYGSFSVIRAASMPMPEDGVRVKGEHRVGDVIEAVKRSSDTLVISSRSDKGYMNLNLDELMGENVLVRKVKFPNNWRTTTWLYTSSKWANVALYKLRPSPHSYNIDDVELRLGRAEPNLIPTLKRSMINTKILSEFIEVGGENIEFERIELEIPYANSDGQHIRVLRYDESYRQWFEQPFSKDLLNAQVNFTSNKAGVFVVVE